LVETERKALSLLPPPRCDASTQRTPIESPIPMVETPQSPVPVVNDTSQEASSRDLKSAVLANLPVVVDSTPAEAKEVMATPLTPNSDRGSEGVTVRLSSPLLSSPSLLPGVSTTRVARALMGKRGCEDVPVSVLGGDVPLSVLGKRARDAEPPVSEPLPHPTKRPRGRSKAAQVVLSVVEPNSSGLEPPALTTGRYSSRLQSNKGTGSSIVRKPRKDAMPVFSPASTAASTSLPQVVSTPASAGLERPRRNRRAETAYTPDAKK